MPLARIITRSPDDAYAIHQYLVDRGYRVEFADPSALNSEPTDLEIDVERCPVEEGLRLAAEWAETARADVYVASGALPVDEPERPRVDAATPEIASYVPLTLSPTEGTVEETAPRAEVLRETIGNAAGIVADSLHETREAVSQSFSDMKQRFLRAREERAPEPSRLERWNRALAERRTARQERKAREAARLARQQREQREARAAALARELREQPARETVTRPVQPAAERRLSAARRISHASDEAAEYWRGAFTGAAVVAIVLMVAWATLGPSRPSAPATTSGHVKQDVPFGPVTLTPSAAPARPAAVAPQTPAPHAVTPPPKPAPVRSHGTHRAARDSGIAEDEVIVHHYGTPTKPAPSSASARNSGPKRITDDQ